MKIEITNKECVKNLKKDIQKTLHIPVVMGLFLLVMVKFVIPNNQEFSNWLHFVTVLSIVGGLFFMLVINSFDIKKCLSGLEIEFLKFDEKNKRSVYKINNKLYYLVDYKLVQDKIEVFLMEV